MHKLIFIFILLFVFSFNCVYSNYNTNISKNKNVLASISYSEKATAIEQLATKEVQKYLNEITGLSYNTYPINKNKSNVRIILGKYDTTPIIQKLIPKSQFNGLKQNGYIIHTKKEKNITYFIITGSTPKAVLNGAYGFIEEVLKQITDTEYADIDFKLPNPVSELTLSDINVIANPYSPITGIELDCGMGLETNTLLNPTLAPQMIKAWKEMVDFARRHKMTFITNWPYGGDSMNDFPNIVTLDNKKYPKPVSNFSSEEIKEAAKIRRQLLQYATENGVDPYLMAYIPGWTTSTIRDNYPNFSGKPPADRAEEGFGTKVYNWGNTDVHAFLADLSKAVTEQYPEAKGLHLRVWGGESAPDKENANRYAELIQKMIKGMVTSASSTRPEIKFILSGYTNYSDHKLNFLMDLKKINPNIIAQIKWDRDWGVSNNPNIPANLNWANTNDGIPKTISVSIPHEEAIPMWFPSVRLFQEGIQKTVKKGEETISGWPTVIRDWHLNNNDNALNVMAICKLAWDPFGFDTQKFYLDSYSNLFGQKIAPEIVNATNLSNQALSDFLYDYGGIVPGMDAGNWYNIQKNLIGTPKTGKTDKMIANIIDGDSTTLSKIKKRLETVIPLQKQAASILLRNDNKVLYNREIYENMLTVNQLWNLLLESRLAAVNFALTKSSAIAGKHYFNELIRYDNEMIEWIKKLTNVSAQSMPDYTDRTKADFINHIESELKYLSTIKH